MKNDSQTPVSFLIGERAYTAFLFVMTFLLVGALLYLGLRSKNWPLENDVQWLPDLEAIRFHSPSMAYVDNLKIGGDRDSADGFTFHFRISVPDLNVMGFRPILTLYSASDEQQLAVWHWGPSVIAMNGDDYDFTRRWPRISADNVLTAGAPVSITLSSGSTGTRMFVDGSLVRSNDRQILSVPDEGRKLRLILGNSVYGKHGWDGDFYSLAMFEGELTPVEVAKYFEELPRPDDLRLFYSFREGQGRTITDKSAYDNSMVIPNRPLVLKRRFLSTPWHDVHSRSFWLDALLNFLGFIPLGALVYTLLRQLKGLQNRYAAPAAALFGCVLSLTIELIQVWLPARASSLLDLTLNSTGAVVGVVLMRLLFSLHGQRADKQ